MEFTDPLLQALWFIAIPSTLIFAIQSVMTFIGLETHDGLNADFDSDFQGGDAPFQLFTFRNMINFLLGFSWTGVSFYNIIENRAVLISLSFIVGVAFVTFFFLIIRQIEKLAEDNSFKIANALNKTGSVYLPIPGRKEGSGKVQVSIKGSFHELDAITEYDKIETSATVRIVKIESNSLVVVEKI
ncbi:MAG TPA: serine protease [Chryseosolibacter sp.]|jgi:hypothetical protein